jgi:Tol biopolymer transport system component
VIDAVSGEADHVILEHEGAVNAVAFSPGGEQLATAGADGQIKVFVSADGRESKAYVTGAQPVTAVGWSRDGTRLAIGSDDGVVWIWDVKSGAVVETLEHPDLGPVFGVDWGPGDEAVAVVDGYGGLFTWSADGGALEEIARGAGAAWSVDWRPDGRYLLVGASGGAWIHRLSDGARLTLSFQEDGGEDVWMAFTDKGLFAGDEAAFRKLTFRVKDDLRAGAILPVEAMVDAFYREDLLVEFLGGEPIAPPGD